MLPEAKKERHKSYLGANWERKITTAVLVTGDKLVATARNVSARQYLDATKASESLFPLFAHTSCGTLSNARNIAC